jgi:hypothetical protein
MKYIIINKWQLKDCKPHYYLKQVCNDLKKADKLIELYRETESDNKSNTYYIVPFNEEALLLSKEVA